MKKRRFDEFMTKISLLVEDYKDVLVPNHLKLNKNRIRYSGSVYDEKEILGMFEAVSKGWFGLAKYGNLFEKEFPKLLGKKIGALVNSGSSANLLALSALTSKKLKNRLRKGDEIITPAACFPTTINPIIQNNLQMKLVDVDISTLNVDPEILKDAISTKTKAISFAHALGNPAEMDIITELAEDHGLFILEDCSDALGAKWGNSPVGSFGITATSSFYPAHHITMGEGGFVAVNDLALNRIIKSYRDWGRDCYCSSTEVDPNGACKRRFNYDIEGINYDHKYLYTHIGYNLKPTEIQAAMGYHQLGKLENFVERRNINFKRLYKIFEKYNDIFILPKSYKKGSPSWFAFPITINENATFNRGDFQSYLEFRGVETRPFFGGNIIRHPAYSDVKYKISGNLENSDKILKNTLFFGVYPGIDSKAIDFVHAQIENFISTHQRN